MKQNIAHFAQTHHTPLENPKIIHDIRFGGDTPLAAEILAGTANIDTITINDAACLFLTKLFHNNTDPISIQFTAKTVMDTYKQWNKRKSTSNLGHHLRHYHTLLRQYKNLSNDKHKTSKKQNKHTST
tara:strand:+ start:197 stop:580 length:384 start_codon:yes stop_codon:yes gene_type:complete